MLAMDALNHRHGLSRQARLAWLLAVACLAFIGVGWAVGNITDPITGALVCMTMASLLVVGALLVSRVPGNAIGWWLVLAGVLLFAQSFAHGVSEGSILAQPAESPVVGWTVLLVQLLELPTIVIVIIVVPLHFPDGRLPSPRWRWILGLTTVAIVASSVATLFGPGSDGPDGAGEIANPLAAPGLAPLLDALGTLVVVTVVPAFLGAAASVVVRYRRARTVERQQLKWLLAVASASTIAFLASVVVQDEVANTVLYLLGYSGVAALPVAIGVAIMRYHLYDIDRIVSRTVSWTVITAALVVVFIGGVLAIQTVLADVTQAQTLAVAASTLVAAALFQPLRIRVQRAVDRRFDRASVDADRATAAFATRLRDEVDLETLTQELVGTVDEAVRPESSRLWLRLGPASVRQRSHSS